MKIVLEFVAGVGSLMGLIGVSFSNLLSDRTLAQISAAFFLASLCFICWRAWVFTKDKIASKYPDGYAPLSSFARWTTSNGVHSTYELVRHIQIKKPFMAYFDHRFHWSGTKQPVLSSDLQDCGEATEVAGTNDVQVRLKFARAKSYNDVEVMHLKMQCDDTDGKALPYLCKKVSHPIYLIAFRVELLHAPSTYNGSCATVTRTNDGNGGTAKKETLASVPFDAATKSYSWQLSNPEPGYSYKIEWDKPVVPKQRGRPSQSNKSSPTGP